MAKRPVITTVPQTTTNTLAINNNFENVRDKFDNTLSRDGSTPNSMAADLDMDSNDLLNVGTVNADRLKVNGQVIASQTLYSATVEKFSDLSSVQDADVQVGGLILVLDSIQVFERAADAATDEHFDYSGGSGVKWYEAGPNFSTRARMVAAKARMDAAGDTVAVGTIWAAGGVLYEADSTATAISDMSGWKLFQLPSEMTFNDYEFIDAQQLAYIRSNDLDSQDEALVTAGVQAMMDAAMAYVVAGGSDDRSAVIVCRGTFAVNDEIFSETFAQSLWDIASGTHARFTFDFWGASFEVKNWPSHKAVRTSGFYADQSITDAVPTVMFRWEQKSKKGLGPHILGGSLTGARALTDPIGLKMRNVNRGYQNAFEIRDLLNVGRWIDDINNSDFFGTIITKCGYQPTQAGGTGFIDAATTISTVAGSGTTTATASAAVFDATDHVGKWVMIANAGEGGTTFAAQITSVTSATEVILNRECTTDVVDETFSFSMLTGSTTANSATLTLDTDVTDDLIGRYVIVYKAGSKLVTDQDLLVTRVTGQSSKTLTLASQAANTVANTAVCIAPSSFIGKSDDQLKSDGVTAEDGHNNDCQFFGERIEYSFDSNWGGAIGEVQQRVLQCQFFGRKVHGTPKTYTNFGANAANLWLDGCKRSVHPGSQFEWGDWHPEMAKIVVVGERNRIRLTDINIGGLDTMDYTANFLIDPQSSNQGMCRVIVSGDDNYSPSRWGLSNQAFARFGSNGDASMLVAGGVWSSRETGNYPYQPPTPATALHIFGGTYPDIQHDGDAVIERGSFTPTLSLGGTEISTLGGAYTTQTGEYFRILDQVFVKIAVKLSALGTATGNADIDLPSYLNPVSFNEHIGVGRFDALAGLNGTIFGATLGSPDYVIRLRQLGSGGTGSTQLTNANLTNTSRIELSGWFKL
jgi:hypothetical protein